MGEDPRNIIGEDPRILEFGVKYANKTSALLTFNPAWNMAD